MTEHCIHLQGQASSLVVAHEPNDLPSVIYWGSKLPSDTDLEQLRRALSRPVPQGGLDSEAALSLLPQHAAGFFGQSGLCGHRQGRNWAPWFDDVRLEQQGNQLVVTADDPRAGLSLVVELQLDADTDVLQQRLSVTNLHQDPYQLDLLSATLPVPAWCQELLTFTGRWCREFMPQRQPWLTGAVVKENRKGRTSHDNFPGIILGSRGFSENQGRVYGAHFAWSGNHGLRAESLPDGRRLLQAYELLHSGEIALAQGESYTTPWLYATYSDAGLNGMSDNFHRFVRRQLADLSSKPRPIHLNSWEAIYFDHDPAYIAKLATAAAEVGVERFIVDDGWFRGRLHDRAALGDWFVDREKYPEGLQPLIQHVNQLGMEFGLWFEPEMVNQDSDLYRAHPEWMLCEADYQQPSGRNQYLLDLAQQPVYDYLLERLDALLSENNIAYIKWDMNRDLVQASHQGCASVHRQTQAVYRLLADVRARHPRVEIESCASGGGRIDYAVLAHTQRFWTSDCNDALERQQIQRGFSYFFPPELMGAHIGPDTSHTTSRRHSLDFRALTALPGHFGLECDVSQLSDEHKQALKARLALHKSLRPLLHSGRTWRYDTADQTQQAYGVVSQDQREAVIWVAQLQMPYHSVPQPLQILGLDTDSRYRVEPLAGLSSEHSHLTKTLPAGMKQSLVLSGAQLAGHGVQLPVLDPESVLLLKLTRQDND